MDAERKRKVRKARSNGQPEKADNSGSASAKPMSPRAQAQRPRMQEASPENVIQFPVAMAGGSHLFPYRTQQLSLHALMVLGWRRPGRVGRCRIPQGCWRSSCFSNIQTISQTNESAPSYSPLATAPTRQPVRRVSPGSRMPAPDRQPDRRVRPGSRMPPSHPSPAFPHIPQ